MTNIDQSRRENKLMAATLFAFFVSGAACQSLGPLIPFLRSEYSLSYDFSGIMLSCQSIGNLAAVFLSGFLPSILGRRKTILIMSIWMGISYLLIAGGFFGAAILPLACLMMGIAKGGNANFSNTMMSTLPGKKSAIGYNLLHGAFAIGALLSPLVIIACTKNDQNGWKLMAYALLVLCLIQFIVYIKMPLPPENIKKSIKSVDKSFLKNRSFWLGAAILFFYISTEYAITGWLVTYFQDIGVLSAKMSQMMSSLLWLVMFTGRMIGALIVGKVSRKLLLMIDGVGLFVCFLIVFFSRTELPIVLGIMGVGLFMATIYTTAMALGTDSIKGNDLGVSNMILAGSIGGILTPAAVGLVAERAGIQAGMGVVVMMTVFLLISIIISAVSKDVRDM